MYKIRLNVGASLCRYYPPILFGHGDSTGDSSTPSSKAPPYVYYDNGLATCPLILYRFSPISYSIIKRNPIRVEYRARYRTCTSLCTAAHAAFASYRIPTRHQHPQPSGCCSRHRSRANCQIYAFQVAKPGNTF